ncbi:hypothetical protein A5778_20650 [Mycolicibacterium monacense]|nr:hypothetical protein A5778_20650 [Mycolicibacterium monacense]
MLHRFQAQRFTGRDRCAEFLGELPLRGSPRIFFGGVLPLGNRPGALVAARPEGSARMAEQDLDDSVCHPVEQQSRTEFGHAATLAGQ